VTVVSVFVLVSSLWFLGLKDHCTKKSTYTKSTAASAYTQHTRSNSSRVSLIWMHTKSHTHPIPHSYTNVKNAYTSGRKPYTKAVSSYPLLAQEVRDRFCTGLQRQKKKISLPTSISPFVDLYPVFICQWLKSIYQRCVLISPSCARGTLTVFLQEFKFCTGLQRQKKKISLPTSISPFVDLYPVFIYKPYTNDATSYPLLAQARDDYATPKIDHVLGPQRPLKKNSTTKNHIPSH
jgi:hypothetical protein